MTNDNTSNISHRVIFIFLAILCFFVFQQADILHTGASSFAYLNGHFKDFYEYNAKYLEVNNYLPSTYIFFALWNLPLKILGYIHEPTMNVHYLVLMWYKLLPVLFYCASGVIIYKISLLIGLNSSRARLSMYLFWTSPIAFFSQFIFGQYDIFTVFFLLLSIFFFFKNNILLFVVFGGISLTFKYFPVFILLPLICLREKKIIKILCQTFILIIPALLEIFLYHSSPAFLSGVGGFGAKNYILTASFNIEYANISIIILIWMGVCGQAYLTSSPNLIDKYKSFLYFSNIIIFAIFGLSMWHPQWVIFAIPFMALSTSLHSKVDALCMLDVLLMLFYICFTVNQWPDHVDQALFRLGILRYCPRIMEKINNFPIRELFVINDKSLFFTGFSGLLLVNALFKHPRHYLNNLTATASVKMNWLRCRFLLGLAIFLIPAGVSLYVAIINAGSFVINNTTADKHFGELTKTRNFSQSFIIDKTASLKRIDLMLATFIRHNNGSIQVSLLGPETKVLAETSLAMQDIQDNAWHSFFKNSNIILVKDIRYTIKLSTENAEPGNAITWWATAKDTYAHGEAIVDGKPTSGDFCFKLFLNEQNASH